MNDLVEMLDLGPFLDRAGVEYRHRNFEIMYAEVKRDESMTEVAEVIEERVFEYFSALSLPDEPTLYDRLLLSLRSKDVVATFNWDPFLSQAYERVAKYVKPPRIMHLHGCVSVGFCEHHERLICGPLAYHCPVCERQMVATNLLYPVGQKDYSADRYLKAAWHDLAISLKDAFIFTVFGYAAPDSDAEAVQLLQNGWGDPEKRSLEEVEIIDIQPAEQLGERWRPFLCRSHWRVARTLEDSVVGKYPRRSMEAMWEMLMMCAPRPSFALPQTTGWAELIESVQPLVDEEDAMGSQDDD